MADETVHLIECQEEVLIAAQQGLIGIQCLDPEYDQGKQVRIYVDMSSFLLPFDSGAGGQPRRIYCSGFVRAHLEGGEEYDLKYDRIR